MQCPQSDSRSGRVVFACHCLLNANAKVCGLAKFPGAMPDLLDLLAEKQAGIIQLPCPEFLHMGPNRWWQARSQYDHPAFRSLCARLADEAAEQAATYVAAGYAIPALLGVEGSPSCGVAETYDTPKWGGRPREINLSGCRVNGAGIFMQELERAFTARSLNVPFKGLGSTDDPAVTLKGVL
ncbi:CD3072 family TudS-related putative desulfidase [Pseudodesulfovibrio sp. zrk46]|uniref:CD3072 family TudS-related putative desulfidase n=1 Tax=Pseudodesulfovibrio sp. zrk46 TaxID=2725288 RepID=UPI001449993D|nr:CD3072 family TudS-related putative desulfidase [Pseudodesulfovibrio sp. zrk46]QJB55914.1 hypothetical protein HFN16_05600 [Pseudodesulfovibrio sp. zrk46]